MRYFLFFIYSVFLWGCSGTNHLSKEYWSSHHLKKYVGEKSSPSQEFIAADSLLKLSQHYAKEEMLAEAVWAAKASHLYYRLGLMKQELKKSEGQLKTIEQDVDKESEHINSLQEVFDEIRSMRKP